MDKKLVISPSPHIHSDETSTRLMRDVLIALIPALSVSLVVYGINTAIVTSIAVLSCVVFEYLIQRFMLKGQSTIGNLSAVLTGVLLAFNLPATIPIWLIVLGSLVAIGVAKMSFGGLGHNIFNPALVGRVFLLISFPVQMTSFSSPLPDATSAATPLSFVKEALSKGVSVSEIMPNLPSYTDMLLGLRAGSLGEIAALALILGFLYMLWRKVITWHIPIYVIGSMALLSLILWIIEPEKNMDPFFHILTGGSLLGAIFMATDYVTSPMHPRTMAIFGIGIGVLTILIRVFGSYPEGLSFAILIMNATVPLLNKYIKPRIFGVITKK